MLRSLVTDIFAILGSRLPKVPALDFRTGYIYTSSNYRGTLIVNGIAITEGYISGYLRGVWENECWKV